VGGRVHGAGYVSDGRGAAPEDWPLPENRHGYKVYVSDRAEVLDSPCSLGTPYASFLLFS
jgi:hypothetical protein